MSLTAAQARKVALSFPGAQERLSYGTPAIFVKEKVLVRIGTREPGTLQLNVDSFDERELMVEFDPKTFFFTEHFRSSRSVLARLDHLDPKLLHGLLERRWRKIAPKKMLRALDEAAPKRKTRA